MSVTARWSHQPFKATLMGAAHQPYTDKADVLRYLHPGALDPALVPRKSWTPALAGASVGIAFFLLGALFDIILQHHGIGTPAILWGDLLAGIVGGLLVLFYERQRRKEFIHHLEIIRLMNHHVRNSLQVIAYASSSEHRAQHVEKVRHAIERIDWALREVLPGHVPSKKDLPDF